MCYTIHDKPRPHSDFRQLGAKCSHKKRKMSSNFGFTSFGNLGSIVQQVQQVATQVSQFQQSNHMHNKTTQGKKEGWLLILYTLMFRFRAKSTILIQEFKMWHQT